MADRTVTVRLAAMHNQYIAAMAQSAAATKAFGTSVYQTAARTNLSLAGMSKQGTSALGALGLSGKMVLGGLLVGELYAAGKAAMDFESSFAGIRKTVDATEPEFEALAQDMRDLAKEIPINVNELNRIGEAAGQLDVAKDSIVGFTETVALMGVTTNLTSDQAADQFARFSNITQMPQENFDRLGSTVVALGNNLAATEAEISEFGLRIAGAGELAGLTEAEILAIGGAMSSVGVEAEAGGTAIQKVLLGITDSVNSADERLDLFAQTAGMSASEFQAAWEADPAAAFTAFVEGLGAAGKDATSILRNLNLTDQRLMRSFLALAGSGDTLRDAIELGNDAWRENSALTEEAGKRFETTASQIQLAKNQINDFQITAGNELLPVLGEWASLLTDVMLVDERHQDNLASSRDLVQQLAESVRLGNTDIDTFMRNVESMFEGAELPAGVMEGTESLKELRAELEQIRDKADVYASAVGLMPEDLISQVNGAITALDMLDATILQLGAEAGTSVFGQVGEDLANAVGTTEAFGRAQGNARGQVDGMTDALNAQADAIARLQGASGLLGIEGAAIAAERAQQKLAEAQADVNAALRSGGRRSAAYKDAVLGLREAELSATETQIALANAVQSFDDKVAAGEINQKDAIALVREFGRAAGLTRSDIEGLIGRIRDAGAAYDGLPREKRTRVVAEGIDPVLASLRAVANALAGIPRTVTTTVNVRTVESGYTNQRLNHSGGTAGSGAMRYGPRLRSDEFPTILQRGEAVASNETMRRVARALEGDSSAPPLKVVELHNHYHGSFVAGGRAGAEELAANMETAVRDREVVLPRRPKARAR